MRAWQPALMFAIWAPFASLQSGCSELWQGFSEANPSSCVTGGAICPEGTVCVASAGLCMAPDAIVDGALPDGGTAMPEDMESPSSGFDLHAVWGTGASDVWIVGDQGMVLRWDGTALRPVTTPIRIGLKSVHGLLNGNRTLVGGGQGEVWEYVRNTGLWTQLGTGIQSQVRAVAMEAMKQWLAGDEGRCLERTMGSFVDRMCAVSGTVYGINLDGATVLAVGDNGAVRSWDGFTWSIENPGTTATLRSITAVGNQYFTVGSPDASGWVLLRRGGAGSWVRTAGPAQTPRMLYGASARSTQEVWAVGEERTLLRFDGTQWSSTNCPITRSTGRVFLGVWADPSSSEAWAVGKNGLICRWNGTSWSEASL